MDKKMIQKSIIAVFWLAVWQAFAVLIRNPILFASPIQTGRALLENVLKGAFWQVIGMTLLRIGFGFLAGVTMGVLLAVLAYRFPFSEAVLKPVISVMKTVPVVCFVVLFLIWWGAGFLSVAISFLMVFSTIYFSTLEGLKATQRNLLEMADVFRFPLSTRITYIYRPALRPFLMGSMKTSLGLAWKAGVAAEVIGLPEYSIGEKLYMSKISIDTAGIFAWTVVICVLSFLFEKLILRIADIAFHVRMPYGVPKIQTSRPFSIRMENLSKSFGQQNVVGQYSETIGAGDIKWFTGPSGSGKTTLFRMLLHLEKPDEGQIEGTKNGNFAVLFQEDRLCEEYTALENVEMVAKHREEASKVLGKVLETSLFDRKCAELSGGEKRRVALARALAAGGGCLILDEPFAGLDKENIHRCMQVILQEKGERTLLIASHVIPEGVKTSG